MGDSKKFETLLMRETENALGLAAMSARNASKATERVVHVVDIAEPSSIVSMRASAMRLRIIASECLEAAMTIGAEAARIEILAMLQIELAKQDQPPPGRK